MLQHQSSIANRPSHYPLLVPIVVFIDFICPSSRHVASAHVSVQALAHLYDHLRNTVSSEGFATHKFLSLKACGRIERCRDCQEHRCSNQTRRTDDDAEPLYNGHDYVDERSHVIRGKLLHEGVKF